jgi:MinD superfamily P-loop ATPase
MFTNGKALVGRKIIRIDEEKCDGCGVCTSWCHSGAIQLVEGKARLVREAYCDGLAACVGECPRGAIRVAEREVA